MAIDFNINQLRTNQLIATGSFPKIVVYTDYTNGASLKNGTITDGPFVRATAASDVYFIISGSRYRLGDPNSNVNGGATTLFFGDVAFSGAVSVQTVHRGIVVAPSSSFFASSNLNITNSALSKTFLINNDRLFSSGTSFNLLSANATGIELTASNNISIFNTAGTTTTTTFIKDSSFLLVGNALKNYISSSTSGSILSNDTLQLLNSTQVTAVGNLSSNITNSILVTQVGNAVSIINTGNIAGIYSSYTSTINRVTGAAIYTSPQTRIEDSSNASNYSGVCVAVGTYNSRITKSLNAFILGGYNHWTEGFDQGIVGGNDVTFAANADHSFAFGARSAFIDRSNFILIGNNQHKTWFSGSIACNNISGSLRYLTDGQTKAFDTFFTQSSPIHINTASNGQIQFGAITKIPLGHYIVSVATISNPQIIGGGFVNRFEHDFIDPATSYVKFRCVLSTFTNSQTAVIKLWNVSDGGYVQIGGAGVFGLSTSLTTPTVLASANLAATTLGLSTSNKIYEVHTYITGSGTLLGLQHHTSELIFAPRNYSGYN